MLLSPRTLRALPFKEDPFEKRTFTFRPVRKAVCLLCLLSGGLILFKRRIKPGDLASETYQSYKDLHLRLPPTTQNTISSQWVGGGSVVPPSPPNNDLGDREREEQNTFYDTLPDVIRMPLVEAVRDVELDGWEDEWFAHGRFDVETWGPLEEPKMDFVYNWVTDQTRPSGKYNTNRHAARFINKIQILVNSVTAKPDGTGEPRPQRPSWLREDPEADEHVQVLSQEAFFREEERRCPPTFNSLAIESEIYMTLSATDRLVALSDDTFLGMPHAASDSTRPCSAHFGHSVSWSVMRETMASFPGPAARGVCDRFRGESHHHQIYPWYAGFHYSIERFREALLWSFVIARSDTNGDGYLDWMERCMILDAVEPGWQRLSSSDSSELAKQNTNRDRMYYRMPQMLEKAGLEAPIVNVNVLWTSVDGPETIRNIKCHDCSVDKCFADSFSSPLSDDSSQNTDFMASNVFSRLASQHPDCGDCLI
ncbi:hypothetical protein DL770_011892 [Monosporascus sp. CRB-9-2]|nr:hypothetical protein DL770_011892 [Monosporascus sp. CRB-9-2]